VIGWPYQQKMSSYVFLCFASDTSLNAVHIPGVQIEVYPANEGDCRRCSGKCPRLAGHPYIGSHSPSDPSELPLIRKLPGLAPSKWNRLTKIKLIVSPACIHKCTNITAYRYFNFKVVALYTNFS